MAYSCCRLAVFEAALRTSTLASGPTICVNWRSTSASCSRDHAARVPWPVFDCGRVEFGRVEFGGAGLGEDTGGASATVRAAGLDSGPRDPWTLWPPLTASGGGAGPRVASGSGAGAGLAGRTATGTRRIVVVISRACCESVAEAGWFEINFQFERSASPNSEALA